MRLVGTMENEQQARHFSDYLTQLNLDNHLILEADGTSEIWILNEDDVEKAVQLFVEYSLNPANEKYKGAAQEAARINKIKKKESRRKPPIMDVRTTIFNRGILGGVGKMTLLLILISSAVFILTGFGFTGNPRVVSKLMITAKSYDLPEIFDGEIWRLITPIFVHGGFMHIIFNMWWLKDLGTLIEYRKSSLFLGLFVLVTGVVSNVAQFFLGGLGGGFSGVIYAMLGYIWMKGKFDPSAGLWLPPQIVNIMLIWLVICFTGIMGPIGNVAHVSGLGMGVAWGYFTSPKFKKLFKT